MATTIPESASPTMDATETGIVVRFSPTNVTHEKYDETIRRLKQEGTWPPEGLEFHVLFGPEDNLRVSEVWASKAQFDAQSERLMPILKDVGIEFAGEPEILEVHKLIRA
jgi:hypothetical protein